MKFYKIIDIDIGLQNEVDGLKGTGVAIYGQLFHIVPSIIITW